MAFTWYVRHIQFQQCSDMSLCKADVHKFCMHNLCNTDSLPVLVNVDSCHASASKASDKVILLLVPLLAELAVHTHEWRTEFNDSEFEKSNLKKQLVQTASLPV